MSAGRNIYGVVALLFFLLFMNVFNRVGNKSLFFFREGFFLASAVSSASLVRAPSFLVLIL